MLIGRPTDRKVKGRTTARKTNLWSQEKLIQELGMYIENTDLKESGTY